MLLRVCERERERERERETDRQAGRGRGEPVTPAMICGMLPYTTVTPHSKPHIPVSLEVDVIYRNS